MLRLIAIAAISLATVQFAGTARAQQTYPTRTVRLILPFNPGSAVDITARLFANRLSERWGKPVVIENRPGGDGLVAIGAYVSAKDDHTLFFGPVGIFTALPYQHETLPYDARDLVPIVSVSVNVLAFSVPTSLHVEKLSDLVALARAKPGILNAAAAQGTTDFLLSGFITNLDLQIVKVPYRDIMQAPNDLAESRIQLLSTSLAVALPMAQAGRIKVLAVTSRQRAPIAPDVPTVTEAGYPALTMESVVGLFGPRSMSESLRESIAADFRKIAADPAIEPRLNDTGQIMSLRGPAELAASVQEQRDQFAAIAKKMGLKAAQ
ncbi:MAG: tripartite tricarboxylate transporter substrate binding protein [Xanthobacteraceae bacterium]|jgi:tripartite-type tricarboxylate transporter receptor subunit TctC